MEYVLVSISGGVAHVEKVTSNVVVEIRDYDVDGADEDSNLITVDEHGQKMIRYVKTMADKHIRFDGNTAFCGQCGKGFPKETMEKVESQFPEMNMPDQYICRICIQEAESEALKQENIDDPANDKRYCCCSACFRPDFSGNP